MQLRMWMIDLGREQAPTLDHVRRYLDFTRESGYNAAGLYFEHRFAYPSTTWAHGKDCVTPEMFAALQSEYPEIQIIPFLNLLGHFEGFLYTEHGKRYRESLFEGMQACPSSPEFVELCNAIVDDALAIFKSDIIHIGGDETWQLGKCPRCQEQAESLAVSRLPLADRNPASDTADGKRPTANDKALLYGQHFGPLAKRVSDAGRRPAVWGDMFLEHPSALDCLPKETVVFDWQYHSGLKETSPMFLEKGFEVVGCPTIHTFDAAWAHVEGSEENVRTVIQDAVDLNLFGVCLTTWECGLFGSYDTIFPMVRASGEMIKIASIQCKKSESSDVSDGNSSFLFAYRSLSEHHEEWARLMGVELNDLGGIFAFDGHRSRLKTRLLLYSNPFLLWMRHGEELCGENGGKILAILEKAESVAPGETERGVTLFVKWAVQFVQLAEEAHQAYAQGKPGEALKRLTVCRGIFEDLERIAKKTHVRIGGSLADIERCKACRAHVETVMRRIQTCGDGSLGYLPAFEIISHPMFVPHDQACWWLVNKWGRE